MAAVALSAMGAQGCAGSADQPVEKWQQALLERQPLSPAERTQEARTLLRDDKLERIQQIHQRVVEAIVRVALRSSPQRMWKGVRRVGRAVWNVRERGPSEDAALDWLELGLTAPATPDDPQLSALYTRLHAHELDEFSKARVAASKAALEEGRFDVARLLLKRALQLQPDSKPALERLADVQHREQAQLRGDGELVVHDWDVRVAEALLAGGEYGAALELKPADREQRFARAAAQLLHGERDTALVDFGALASRRDPLGKMAEQWLERPEIDADGDLARAVHHYRWKRVLGWIGGNALAEHGAHIGSGAFSAWRKSFTPTNLGLSLPARVLRGWKPDGREVREAAMNYLDLKPHGPHAEAARQWLDDVGWPHAEADGGSGAFALRAVQTPFAHVGVPPVLVSRHAIDSDYISGAPALRSALEGRNAVWLEARKKSADEDEEVEGFALSPAEARRLLDELSFGVEQGHLRTSLASDDAVLERLRRVDDAVASGYVLYAESWVPPSSRMWSSLKSTVLDGKEESGAIAFERGQDDLVAARTLGDQIRECPTDMLCIDHDGRARTTVYGYLDMSSGMGFGFQSMTRLGGMSIGMSGGGPEASLVLPLGRWLGIQGWLPIEAEFSIAPGDFYVGPVLRKRSCNEDRDSDESTASQLLPLGLRSRCSIRLY